MIYTFFCTNNAKNISLAWDQAAGKKAAKSNRSACFARRYFSYFRDLSEISRGGGGGGGNRGRVTTFWDCRKGRGHEKWAVKRGKVMQIHARDHVEVHPQKKKEVLYLVKKPGRNRRVKWSAVRIRVGLLMLSSKMYVYGITKNRLEIYFELS